ncbi:class F sortase [Streptomyces sp. CC208A]|uniref:class F sortase n=1 Tax=Streptomyces sp. CC208A TaxID=3044573 RepID=UPI0024A9DD8C|nr:class F sortase [Streptomyces sp. CC208A]
MPDEKTSVKQPPPDSAGEDASRRRPARWVAPTVFWTTALAALLVLLGPKTFTQGEADTPRSEASSTALSAPVGASTPSRAPHQAPPGTGPTSSPAMSRAIPTRLKIDKIGVDAPFTDLEIGPSGALDPPPADDVNLVGWHAAGIAPGERGTALIAGHLDTATAPAVFARLGELQTGDSFEVTRADGTTAVFLVDSVESFSKDDFPNQRVYDDTPDALVRLITCAGPYDRTAKDYTENLVVFAHLQPAD